MANGLDHERDTTHAKRAWYCHRRGTTACQESAATVPGGDIYARRAEKPGKCHSQRTIDTQEYDPAGRLLRGTDPTDYAAPPPSELCFIARVPSTASAVNLKAEQVFIQSGTTTFAYTEKSYLLHREAIKSHL